MEKLTELGQKECYGTLFTYMHLHISFFFCNFALAFENNVKKRKSTQPKNTYTNEQKDFICTVYAILHRRKFYVLQPERPR